MLNNTDKTSPPRAFHFVVFNVKPTKLNCDKNWEEKRKVEDVMERSVEERPQFLESKHQAKHSQYTVTAFPLGDLIISKTIEWFCRHLARFGWMQCNISETIFILPKHNQFISQHLCTDYRRRVEYIYVKYIGCAMCFQAHTPRSLEHFERDQKRNQWDVQFIRSLIKIW